MTPLGNGTVDTAALAKHIEHQIAAGATGLVVN